MTALSNNPSFYLIIPIFNEEENLPNLFNSFQRHYADLKNKYDMLFILVDDGSTDNTSTAARNLSKDLPFHLIELKKNQGPGAAFRAGFEFIQPKLKKDDWVMTLEGDNTSRFELVQQMLKRSEEGYDVVLASPYMYGGGISNTTSFRVILSHVANTVIKEFLGINGILTMSSFFRLYKAGSVIQPLQAKYGAGIIERNGFESMIELLIKIVKQQNSISEVAMKLDTSLRKGKSKMKVLRTIRGYLTLWFSKRHW